MGLERRSTPQTREQEWPWEKTLLLDNLRAQRTTDTLKSANRAPEAHTTEYFSRARAAIVFRLERSSSYLREDVSSRLNLFREVGITDCTEFPSHPPEESRKKFNDSGHHPTSNPRPNRSRPLSIILVFEIHGDPDSLDPSPWPICDNDRSSKRRLN